jgi:LmbE family N-acetylglucosaminyl deacetylase
MPQLSEFYKSPVSWRERLTRRFRRLLISRSREMTADMLQRPAIVFSPHQDDETLGCGGTIIRKTAAGAEVQVVFMTDGRQSHKHLLDPERLSEIRRCEARAACGVLGVPEANITFLNFPDGELLGHKEQAAAEVRQILDSSTAVELYLPYQGEPTDDHRATHAVLQAALAGQERAYTIFEYIVWFWHHWPWVSLFQGDAPNRWFVIKNSVRARFGLSLLRFRSSVPVAAVREQKTAALQQHKSQMTKLFDNPSWLTLYDVSEGEFLNNSFQEHELFYQYVYNPKTEAR